MRHRADEGFWAAYQRLPEPVKLRADKAFDLLKSNPKHPSVHFKKIGRRWSARVDLNYRALALETDDGYFWYWIGSHDDYERMLRGV